MLALAIPCFTVPIQIFQLTPGDFDLGTSLPLQLCDFALGHRRLGSLDAPPAPVALTYYWGLDPDHAGHPDSVTRPGVPAPAFFAFWCMHFLIVWSALYLTLGLGIGPTWRDYRVTVALTALWAVVVYVFDVAVDVNYGYLVDKPASASLLDAFGPWPVYVFASLGILLGVWALMTWPWVAHARVARPSWQSPNLRGCAAHTRSTRCGWPRAPLMARLPDGALMQRAASGLAVAIAALLGRVYAARVLLLVGAGDNGGDALWAGAMLARRGAAVEAVLLSSKVHLEGLAALRAYGGRTVAVRRGATGPTSWSTGSSASVVGRVCATRQSRRSPRSRVSRSSPWTCRRGSMSTPAGSTDPM